jgi:hypothetical protein
VVGCRGNDERPPSLGLKPKCFIHRKEIEAFVATYHFQELFASSWLCDFDREDRVALYSAASANRKMVALTLRKESNNSQEQEQQQQQQLRRQRRREQNKRKNMEQKIPTEPKRPCAYKQCGYGPSHLFDLTDLNSEFLCSSCSHCKDCKSSFKSRVIVSKCEQCRDETWAKDNEEWFCDCFATPVASNQVHICQKCSRALKMCGWTSTIVNS